MNSNEQEINRLVFLAQNAEGDARKNAMENIYKKLIPFRFALAKRYANKGVEFDDIAQQIDLKLLEAVIDYDDSKDSSALRHLISRARNGVWNYYRKEMNYFDGKKITLSLDKTWINNNKPQSTGFTSEFDFYEFDLTGHSEYFDEDAILNQIIIKEELAKLTPRQKEILFMYFLDDMTQYTIAEELNINQANVSRAQKRGVESIRKNISPSGEMTENS